MDQRIKARLKRAASEVGRAVHEASADLELQSELDEIHERLVGLLQQEPDGGGDDE